MVPISLPLTDYVQANSRRTTPQQLFEARNIRYSSELGDNTGQDANSIVADPKFVPPTPGTSPGDFGLHSGSPAIGNGADLGSNEEKALAPGVSWLNQVALSIQEKVRWDIGAFRQKP